MRQLTKDDVTFTFELEPDHCTGVRGNYMATDDPVADKAAEDDIIRRVNRDDTSAWCCLGVTGYVKKYPTLKYTAYLGGISLEEGLSYEEQNQQVEEMSLDMHGEVLEALNDELAEFVKKAAEVEEYFN